jgi:hypothetical protein
MTYHKSSSSTAEITLTQEEAVAAISWFASSCPAPAENAATSPLISAREKFDESVAVAKWLREEVRIALSIEEASLVLDALTALLDTDRPENYQGEALWKVRLELEAGLRAPTLPAVVLPNAGSYLPTGID